MRIRIAKTIDVVQSRRACPGEAVVEGLDQADAERAEHGAGQVADPAEHGRGEREQAEREAGVEADVVSRRRRSRPPTPASAPAMRNVNEIVRLTSMPIIAAASLSWAVARIALPCRVYWTSHTSTISTGTVTRTTISWSQV